MKDLCYKCIEERNGAIYFGWDSEHCHHEPREKPESKCTICEKGSFTTYVSSEGRYTLIIVKFCPECGKSLI